MKDIQFIVDQEMLLQMHVCLKIEMFLLKIMLTLCSLWQTSIEQPISIKRALADTPRVAT